MRHLESKLLVEMVQLGLGEFELVIKLVCELGFFLTIISQSVVGQSAWPRFLAPPRSSKLRHAVTAV